jgi:penicillin-binding protein 2
MRRTQRENEDSHRGISRRTLIFGGLQVSAVAILAGRMRYMQVEQADQFLLLAEENRVSIRLVPPTRGQIFDRNGVPIALNEQNYRVVMTREDAGNVDEVLTRLSQLIPISDEERERILRELRRRSPFVPHIVAERLSWEELTRVSVNAPALPGVTPEVGLGRVYPFGPDFVHVLGYVGPVSENDLAQLETPDPVLQIPRFQIGKIGVERRMEDILRGKAGSRRIEVNAAGRIMRELSRREGEEGEDLRLTIDASLQNYANLRMEGESASAVVMDVENGDILCLASVPTFDPNLFVRGISNSDYQALLNHEYRPLANKAVSGAYPPGSTFKMVTALAALEAGVITPETRVRCPGHYDAGGRRFHCWKRSGHGAVDLIASLAESCDVYYYDISQRVGIDAIAEMSRRLGLGVRHDLPLSAITEGLNPNRAWKRDRRGQEWRIGDTINASIGQGYVLSSPLQLAVMTARLATGREVVPRILRAVGGAETPVLAAAPLGLSAENLRLIQRGMWAVTNTSNGTAYSSRSDDKATLIAGKTGTSQVRNISAAERARGVLRNDQLPWNRRDHALYVAYAPSENPRYAVSVIVEHGGGGSTAAAPIARDILLFALHGKVPPLSAYPASQRNRIDSQHRKMPLTDFSEPSSTGRTRA